MENKSVAFLLGKALRTARKISYFSNGGQFVINKDVYREMKKFFEDREMQRFVKKNHLDVLEIMNECVTEDFEIAYPIYGYPTLEDFKEYVRDVIALFDRIKETQIEGIENMDKFTFLKDFTHGFVDEKDWGKLRGLVYDEVMKIEEYSREFGIISILTSRMRKARPKDLETLLLAVKIFAPELMNKISNVMIKAFIKNDTEALERASKYKNIIGLSDVARANLYIFVESLVTFLVENYLVKDKNPDKMKYLLNAFYLNIEGVEKSSTVENYGREILKFSIAFLLSLKDAFKRNGFDIEKFLGELDKDAEHGWVAVVRERYESARLSTVMLLPHYSTPTLSLEKLEIEKTPNYLLPKINLEHFKMFKVSNNSIIIPKKVMAETLKKTKNGLNFKYFLEIYNAFMDLLYAKPFEENWDEKTLQSHGLSKDTTFLDLMLNYMPLNMEIVDDEKFLDFLNNDFKRIPIDKTSRKIYILTDKGEAFIWSKNCSSKINEIKQLLPHALVIGYFKEGSRYTNKIGLIRINDKFLEVKNIKDPLENLVFPFWLRKLSMLGDLISITIIKYAFRTFNKATTEMGEYEKLPTINGKRFNNWNHYCNYIRDEKLEDVSNEKFSLVESEMRKWLHELTEKAKIKEKEMGVEF